MFSVRGPLSVRKRMFPSLTPVSQNSGIASRGGKKSNFCQVGNSFALSENFRPAFFAKASLAHQVFFSGGTPKVMLLDNHLSNHIVEPEMESQDGCQRWRETKRQAGKVISFNRTAFTLVQLMLQLPLPEGVKFAHADTAPDSASRAQKSISSAT